MTWTFECPSFARSDQMVFWIKNSAEYLVTRDGLPTFPPIFRRLDTSSVTYFWKVRVLIPISFANRALLGLPYLGYVSQSATAFFTFWSLEWLMRASILFFGGSLAAANFLSVSTIFFRFACSSGVTFMDFCVAFDRWWVSFILSFLDTRGRSSLSRNWIFVTWTLLRRSHFSFSCAPNPQERKISRLTTLSLYARWQREYLSWFQKRETQEFTISRDTSRDYD